MRIGYLPRSFESRASDGRVTRNETALAALQTLRDAGATLTAVEAPPGAQLEGLSPMDLAERGAAFQEALRSGKLAELESSSTWPPLFRMAQFISAAAYINAHRVRARYCHEWWQRLRGYDVVVTAQLNTLAMSMAGMPAMVVPTGERALSAPRNGPSAGAAEFPAGQMAVSSEGRPSIAFFGAPFQDEKVLALASAYQRATAYHRLRPPSFP